MDETLTRRLLGATVLLLLAFGLASLLPGPPDREPGKSGQPVVAYDLRTGQALNLEPQEAPPPPVHLKPVEMGATVTAPQPDAQAGESQATPQAIPVPKPQIGNGGKPATPTPAARGAHRSLKVDESFGAAASTSWYVQVGSFSTRENARAVLQKLFKQGLPAMMQNITVGKKLWYRVRVGPYPSEAPTQQALSAVRAQGYAAAKVVRPDAGGN